MHIKYLAGFVDGEGCIGIIKASPQKKTRETKPRYEPKIAIVNCDYRILEKISITYGGHITTRRKFKPHHRKVFTLTFCGKSLQKLLPILTPHLIIKQTQAKYLSELISTRKHTYRTNSYSLKEMNRKERIYKKCCKLNQLGICD